MRCRRTYPKYCVPRCPFYFTISLYWCLEELTEICEELWKRIWHIEGVKFDLERDIRMKVFEVTFTSHLPMLLPTAARSGLLHRLNISITNCCKNKKLTEEYRIILSGFVLKKKTFRHFPIIFFIDKCTYLYNKIYTFSLY
jgi:hypothetical protein